MSVGRPLAALVLLALAAAALMCIPVGGDAFWLCLPLALFACSNARTEGGGLTGAVLIVAVAAAVLTWRRGAPPPSPLLASAVVAASVGVMVALRRRLERERDAMRDAALTDPLTGVANRRSLLARAEYEIARHAREQRSFLVVMIDLDGFKALNDRFGHAAGDEILRDVTASLSAALRAQDTLARLGGDEFCVLAPLTSRAGAGPLGARISRAVSTATLGVDALRASAGVAVFPQDGKVAAELIHAADTRLLAAKRARKSRLRRLAA